MAKVSAGLLLFRRTRCELEVLLAHPGGPFFKAKDAGAWGVPKGGVEDGEDLLAAARREFQEETGFCPSGTFLALGSVKQGSGKVVHVWAVEGDCDASALRSDTFELEWPPRSGQLQRYPEIDRADWFGLEAARQKILAAQAPLLERLVGVAAGPTSG